MRWSVVLLSVALLVLTACAAEHRVPSAGPAAPSGARSNSDGQVLPQPTYRSNCRLMVNTTSTTIFSCAPAKSTPQGIRLNVTPSCNRMVTSDCATPQDIILRVNGTCTDELHGSAGTVCTEGLIAGQEVMLTLTLTYAESGDATRHTVTGELKGIVE